MKTILSIILVLLTSISVGQIPLMNSYPSATAVIYLDFDGATVRGTSWNWDGSIEAQPAGLSSLGVIEIFNRVSEDYRIFNINITTDSSVFKSAPINRRTRVILTPTYGWYGPAGGVAYVGSFAWGDDTPAWVFTGLLNNNIKYIAEAASHEAGHTLGLQHQSSYDTNCYKTEEYSSGMGTGEISWAPIMGVGYYKNLTTWHNGTNTYDCNSFQDDINIITNAVNGIALKGDDCGNSHREATTLSFQANQFAASGLINTATDEDVYSFIITQTNHLTVTVSPQSTGPGNAGANIDLKISLLNSRGDTISKYNPASQLSVAIDTTLLPASYFLVVEGVGNANLLDYGSLGFYTVVGNLGQTLVIDQIKLTTQQNNGQQQLNWQVKSDNKLMALQLESAVDGIAFKAFKNISPGSNSENITTKNDCWFRMKGMMGEKTIYSNIVSIKAAHEATINVPSVIYSDKIMITSARKFDYHLIDINGRMLAKGKIAIGTNTLHTNTAANGLFFLKISSDRESRSFKIIKQ
ncbi:MAG: T9SS type A sorting domain-containing protein [Chitinophagaceae bacterium]|nr:T9SS type A sorting domain-containing protein [Chitinophagaceae bacterium]